MAAVYTLFKFHRNKFQDPTISGIFKEYKKFKKLVKYEKIKKVHWKEAIYAINNAGGEAFIAHPFKNVKDMKVLDEMVDFGLKGLEIQPTYGEKNIPFLKYAEENNLKTSIGSDYHGAIFTHRPMLNRNKIDEMEKKIKVIDEV